jgi:hypothetical protein
MIAPLAVLASMNVRWTPSLKVTSTRLIQTCAPTVVPALMFVRLKQFTLNNHERNPSSFRAAYGSPFFIVLIFNLTAFAIYLD